MGGLNTVSRGATHAWLADWHAAWIVSYAAALPLNPVTGTDRNGDTTVNDRPVGVGRNSARGFDSASVDVRVGRGWSVGPTRLAAMVDVFNLLNPTNLLLPNNVLAQARRLCLPSAWPPRPEIRGRFSSVSE